MTLNERLIRMAEVGIDDIDIDDAIDIENDETNEDLLADAISNGQNPYFLKYKGIVVKMRFSDTDVTIEERMKGYIDSLY